MDTISFNKQKTENMISQVSFKFERQGQIQPIVTLLQERLLGLKYKVEQESKFIFRIYVASTEGEKRTLDVCCGIQSNAILDFNRIL